MGVALFERADGKVVEIEATGKLEREDYGSFVPEFERLINAHGQIRVLFNMTDFHGWTLGALWEDLKFDLRHFRDIDRVAIIGDKTWERWMSHFCQPFTLAEVRYYDRSEKAEAREWIESGLPVETTENP
jgi:hypothetical protein